MSPRMLRITRYFSTHLSSPSTSKASTATETTAPIDFSFSEHLITTSLPKIDRHAHGFLRELNEDRANLGKLERKINVVHDLLHHCFKKQPEIQFIPVGSASNLLLHRESDLDLVLIPSTTAENWKIFENRFEKSPNFRKKYMQEIRNIIVSSRKIGFCPAPYFNAKTPIIRLESNQKLQVDIQFASPRPIRSSIFIRTCVEFDERVPLLIHWLYKKLEEARILKSADGLFSRYHANVMVIHFLQAIPTPVLPDIISLAPWCSPQFDRLSLLKMTRQKQLYVSSNQEMSNESSFGALALQFIDYFSQLDFWKHGIDTRGKVRRRITSNPSNFEIHDEYFSEPTCRVLGSPQLLTDFFSKLKKQAERRQFDDLFCYHFL